MTDKERILSAIISKIIPSMFYGFGEERKDYIENCMLRLSKLNKNDLVVAATSIYPNDYSVGFVHEVKDDCVVIRKIGSEKLCNYYNEEFYKINKEKLGYEILEGLQYKMYKKVMKAFEYTSYWTRFKGISFDKDKCTVQAREAFENELFFEVSFKFNKKTTIAEIGKILEKAVKNEYEKMRKENNQHSQSESHKIV